MNKTLQVIKYAVSKGYSITEKGVLTGPTNKVINYKLYGKQKYPYFSVNIEKLFPNYKVYGVPVHQFAAYYFYGEKPNNLVVRHLDGNTLNNSKLNLCYGTHSENNLDKPKHIRVNAAKIANASQERHPSLKLTDAEIEEVGMAYLEHLYKTKTPNGFTSKLSKKYGVNRNTITQNAKSWLINNGYNWNNRKKG